MLYKLPPGSPSVKDQVEQVLLPATTAATVSRKDEYRMQIGGVYGRNSRTANQRSRKE